VADSFQFDSQTVLGRIAASVQVRLAEDKVRWPESRLRSEMGGIRKPRSLKAAFHAGGTPRVLAEVKFASPSQGLIDTEFSALSQERKSARAASLASDYLAHGASAVSVLTERDFFGGSPDFLFAAREANPDALLLMKDFIFEPYQLLLARFLGADAVLLIVALLGAGRTAELLVQARALGLSVLVEVHDASEMQVALHVGADLIGINHRNLKDLRIDLSLSERLMADSPKNATVIGESGIESPEVLRRLMGLGYHGFLIGTHFMRTGSPGQALRELRSAAGAR